MTDKNTFLGKIKSDTRLSVMVIAIIITNGLSITGTWFEMKKSSKSTSSQISRITRHVNKIDVSIGKLESKVDILIDSYTRK